MPAKAYSTKGLKIWIGEGGPGVALAPTAISLAAPAVVTVANTAVVGDAIYASNTGYPELDGRWFKVGAPTATELTLIGSNTTGSAGVLAADPVLELHAQTEAFDLSCLAKTIVFNSDAPAAIAAGTYCDPSLSISSPIIPPTSIEFSGNINVADPAYRGLLDAKDDGVGRVVDIVLPFGQGDIVAPAITSLVSWDLPVDGVQGFTATMTCETAPRHIF